MNIATLCVQAVALVGGTVHSMEPGAEPRIATVLVEGGRIVALAPDLELAPGTRRIDCEGKHLVPGLVDALVNFDPEHDALYLSRGVTFLGDIGSDLELALTLREPEWRDRTPGPAYASPGAVLGGDPPTSPGALIVRHAQDAAELVDMLASRGADYLCVQPGLTPENWRALAADAKNRGLSVMGPLPDAVPLEEALDAAQLGVHFLDGLLPVLPDGKRVAWSIVLPRALDPVVELLGARRTFVVPALASTAVRLETPEGKLDALESMASHYTVWWGNEWGARQRAFTEQVLADGNRVLEKQMALVARLSGAGARVVPGSGAPHPWLVPGEALHEELALWVKAGLAPYDVLAQATREGAAFLGQGDERGTLTVGKVADVLVVDGDPRESLASLREPGSVVVRGRVLSRETLDDLIAAVTADQEAKRAAERAPLEIAPPVLPEGVAPLLAGEVETRALGQRVSGERWAVGREADGSLLLVGRMLRPAQGELTASELQIQQRLLNGRLTAFSVRLLADEQEVNVIGSLVGERMQLRREHNGVHLATENTDQVLHALSLGSLGGSVTTAIALGQRERQGRLWVLALGSLFEPGVMEWELVDQPDGRLVRTHSGGMVVEFDEDGTPLGWAQEVGRGQLATLSREATNFGGPGLPSRHDPVAGEAYVAEVQKRRAEREQKGEEGTGGGG